MTTSEDRTAEQNLMLGGATKLIIGATKHQLMAMAMHLIMDEHGHHFAIVREGTALACSEMAVKCLTDAGVAIET